MSRNASPPKRGPFLRLRPLPTTRDHMNGRHTALRCLTPTKIEKELLLHIIAYNLVRALMQRASILHCLELRRASFKGTLGTLRHLADAVHASQGKLRKQAGLLDDQEFAKNWALDARNHRRGWGKGPQLPIFGRGEAL